MLEELLSDVEEQKEERGIAVDFDSIIFLSAYKHKESDNEEYVYMECIKYIQRLETEVWKKYAIKDTRLAITGKTNFRYTIYPKYKENRKDKPEDAKKLANLVKRTKKLIYERLKGIVLANSKVEADDLVLDYARNKDYIVCAIDSDVINQSCTPTFNFHSKHWKWIHDGLTQVDILASTLIDTIKGKSKDNVTGIKGKGKVFAEKFIEELTLGEKDFTDYVQLFNDPEEMLTTYQVCNTNQLNNGKLELSTVEDIEKAIDIIKAPF